MPKEHVPDESTDLLIALMRSYNWVTKIVNDNIKNYGLIPTEFGILEALYHKGSMPLQQIGEKVLVSSGNLTYIVDKLEKKGLLVRKSSSTDRRVIYAELTEEGERLLDENFPKHRDVIRSSVDGLNEEEKKQAAMLLKKLGHAAQAKCK
ncbi:MarR family transcriptional regulator [Paenibacillus pasadenensis]|uniref:MarR family winged helix-turn-helix transcriptional regulator n=1 Tax=Paenibacillus pasadenensis TaxID=217090 RepID=UPI002040EA58|nr:MarR family transcriptional regulator [Paenibacillus pasadenensis]MCM3746429.1 MarR family transcriptional regulator [Paenibacillus pasadenensis]